MGSHTFLKSSQNCMQTARIASGGDHAQLQFKVTERSDYIRILPGRLITASLSFHIEINGNCQCGHGIQLRNSLAKSLRL